VKRACLFVALALLACGDAPAPPDYAPPTRSRAALLLEPPTLAVGAVAEVVVAVVTPPDHAARPYAPPEAVPGLWLLDTRVDEIEKQGERWVQRTRVRIRAREAGRFEYPGGVVEVEAPDGSVEAIELEPVAVEVVSVLGDGGRRAPYGVRRLPAPSADGSMRLGAFVAGALLALASVGLVSLARRRLGERAEPEPVEPPAPPWEAARAELAAARDVAAADPVTALDRSSGALRRYADGRFRARTLARTTEELGGTDPPFLMTTRWTRFLDLLRRIDGMRLPPERPSSEAALALLDESRAFIEESVPQDAPS
jgi:hypothetical protein